jgi:hypothetical protein
MKSFFRNYGGYFVFWSMTVICLTIIVYSLVNGSRNSPYMEQQIPKMGYQTYTRVEGADGCIWRIYLSEGSSRYTRNEIELRPDNTQNCRGR